LGACPSMVTLVKVRYLRTR